MQLSENIPCVMAIIADLWYTYLKIINAFAVRRRAAKLNTALAEHSSKYTKSWKNFLYLTATVS